MTSNGQPAERYELCHSTAQIQALQHQYNLTLVSSTPTKAAYMPGWPSAVFGFVLCFVSIIFGLRATEADTNEPRSGLGVCWGVFHIAFTVLLGVMWLISFGTIESEKATGGWLSIIGGYNLFFFAAGTFSLEKPTKTEKVLWWFILPLMVVQVFGCLAVIVQRWEGAVGSIAYNVTDLNGCTPFNGTAYLEKGARSEAFRIIQTVEVVFGDLSIPLSARLADAGSDSVAGVGVAWGCLLMVLYLPEIIYEGVIAGKGTPVVISGDCMLIELNPKWGFLDSEIENWWKATELITGL